jgi:hypothetical protein
MQRKGWFALFHACLPGFYKSKKTSKDRQSVTGKMSKRTELRRTRRGQRINRKVAFSWLDCFENNLCCLIIFWLQLDI